MNESISAPDCGVWFTPAELRRRNRDLAQHNRRICKTHQGAALPLTEDYFFYAKRAKGQFQTECKTCFLERDKRLKRERYWRDPVYRERYLAKLRRSDQRRQRALALKREQKRARLARVLDKAVSP